MNQTVIEQYPEIDLEELNKQILAEIKRRAEQRKTDFPIDESNLRN